MHRDYRLYLDDILQAIDRIMLYVQGLLDSRAKAVNEEIKLAAAKAISSVVDEKELSEDYIVPSIFNKKVVHAVASAVAEAAHRTGVAGKER